MNRETGGADVMVKRRRPVGVNLGLLSGLSAKGGDVLHFNLFDDVSYNVVFKQRVRRSASSYTWFGEVAGRDLGVLSLAVEDDVMHANLHVPGEGVYEIRSLPDGIHEVREIDPAELLACGGGLVPGHSTGLQYYPAAEGEIEGAGDVNEVDVLVVYTPAARSGAGGTTAIKALINLAVDESNTAYQQSEIDLNLRLVHVEEVNYTESSGMGLDLDRLTDTNDGYIDSVHSLRDTYGADVVSMLVERNDAGGIAWVMQTLGSDFEDRAFSVVRRAQAAGYTNTFAHELGHNMGCAHDRDHTSVFGLYEYSHGHRFDGDGGGPFITIMSYPPGTCIRYFSNPNVIYDGNSTGVVDSEDNARSINNAGSTIENWRPTVVVDTPPSAAPATVFTEPGVGKAIGLQASDDGRPWPPGELIYRITSLPSYGVLEDPCWGQIQSGDLPYTLADDNNQVVYTARECYLGLDDFGFDANDGGVPPEGGVSNVATVTLDVSYLSGIRYETDFTGGLPTGWTIVDGGSDNKTWRSDNPGGRTNPNWTGTFMIVDSYWAGLVDMDEQLITHSIDCSNLQNVTLKFKHSFFHWEDEIGDVDVRVSGGVWQNIARYEGADAEGLVELDLSSIADGQSDVQVRWHYYDAYYEEYWGIDDVQVVAVELHPEAPRGDFEWDCNVDVYDLVILGSSWLSEPNQPGWNAVCDISEPNDSIVNMLDFAVFGGNWLLDVSP
ncbi:MAG: reprolysin-like metallopeptidase [Planctomycetota bacterium]